MPHRNQWIIIYCTIVAFAILYEHQPLLPLLAQQWGRSVSDIALLTTVTMIPLALAPLLYGYVLEKLSSRSMLIGGFSLLLITQALLSSASSYSMFLFLRAFEGLVLPAVFTALMTYTSASGGVDKARRNISIYIASTIIGGFCGRTLTGLVTSLSDWQTAFWMWSILALVAVISLFKLDLDPRGKLVKISATEVRALLQKPVNRLGLSSAFLLFFIFAAILNFLPFRLLELDPTLTTATLSTVYTGYLIGVIISLASPGLVRWLEGERRILLLATLIYLLGILLFLSEHVSMLFVAMFVFAAGMFALHSVLSGYLNHLEASRKGMLNGLYVSFYYSGGALGSILPGFMYQSAGWMGFCALLVGLVLVLCTLIYAMPRSS